MITPDADETPDAAPSVSLQSEPIADEPIPASEPIPEPEPESVQHSEPEHVPAPKPTPEQKKKQIKPETKREHEGHPTMNKVLNNLFGRNDR